VSTMMVFAIPQVERLAKLSRRTIMRWQIQGVFFPEHPDVMPTPGPYRRIYSFADVVGLRTLSTLRRQFDIAIEELRSVGAYLKKHRRSPWSDLRFWVVNGHVVFRDPQSQLLISGKDLSQVAIETIVLGEIAQSVEADTEILKQRDPGNRGRISQNRNIMSNRPVIAGTRITTSNIWQFHVEGYSVDQIIEEYPDLLAEDVEAAIAYEADARKIAA